MDRLSGMDGALAINLDRRPDRWATFETTWSARLGVGVERLSAVEGRTLPGFGERPWFRGRKRDATWGARAGVTLSQKKALKLARERGWDRALILEDDAEPVSELAVASAALARDDWDVLFLGCREPAGPFEAVAPGLIRLRGALDLHAWAVRPHARDWLIEQLPDEASVWSWLARRRAIDRWMRRALGARFRVLALWPPAVVQAEGASDITQGRGGTAAETYDLPPSGSALARAASDLAEDAGDRLRGVVKRLNGF